MKKKVLVIGGAGFLGSHVADELSDRNYIVSIYDKKKSPYLKKNQKSIIYDTKNENRIFDEIKKNEIVYYFADIADIGESKTNPLETINQNILYLSKILNSCSKSKVKKFIYASSLYVYNDYGSFYRATKQCAEILIKEFSSQSKFNYKLLRYGSLYGPRAQNWNGMKKFVHEILEKKRVTYKGNGNEIRDYIYIKDAARLSVDIINYNKNNVFTISGQQSLTVDNLFSILFEIAKIKKKVIYKNKKTLDHYGMTPYRFTPDNSVKLVPTQFKDLGEGLLEVFNNEK